MPRRLLFDVEANGLLKEVTKVHCIAAVDIDTRETMDWRSEEIPQALETMSTADVLVAHYGEGYDFPALAKVKGFQVAPEKRRDTVIIGRLIYPNIGDTDSALVAQKKLPGTLHGKHSIEAWGYRLGVPKLHADIEDWSTWTPQIQERCVGDIQTNLKLWDHLKPDSYSQQAIELEHRIARICYLMEDAGWPFDVQKAQELHVRLMEKLGPIEAQLRAEFGYWFESKNKKKVEDGTYQPFIPKRDDAKRGYIKGQACTQLERVDFNPGSRQHIIKSLMKRGWKPTAFTDSGQPSLDDEILEQLSEQFPEGGPLVEFLLLNKRVGQLATGEKGWLKLVGDDGRMHGVVNPMGTQTSRASHYNPNLGQVPATKSPWGAECRELFTVPPGYKLVGADMAGLQLRGLGHYLHPYDEGALGHAVAYEDPHWRTVKLIGLTDEERDEHNGLHEVMRDKGAKTLIYGVVFGCFPARVGSILRDCCTTARAKNPEWGHLYNRYFGQNQTNKQVGGPIHKKLYDGLGLTKLLDKLKRIRASRDNPFPGSLPGLDGRWVPARSDHSSLAALLQSAEAILCKRWICETYDELERRGFKWGEDYWICGWIHDEQAVVVKEGKEEEVASILVACAERAGEAYGFRVPLASKAKIGTNWSETH